MKKESGRQRRVVQSTATQISKIRRGLTILLIPVSIKRKGCYSRLQILSSNYIEENDSVSAPTPQIHRYFLLSFNIEV